MLNKKWQCKISSTLGELEDTQNNIWGTKDYTNNQEPTIFMGCYGLPDFMNIRNHKGKKALLWCGTDIIHLQKGYWLDDEGKIKVNPKSFCEYLNKYVENWVENKVEQDFLKKLGIKAKVCPSFLGDVNKFKPQKLNKELRYYSSVSGNDFKRYGWDKINKIARKNPHIKYYLYGNTIPWKAPKNVIVRGRVPKEQMNKETKTMTGAIRMVEFDGFSEIICKSILWGQKPISLIKYNYTREKLLKILNKFPWVYK